MEWKLNLLQVKRCNVLFTKMKSFKLTCPSTSHNRMREGRRGGKSRWEFGKWGKQSYSVKHDSPEGSTQRTVMGSRDGMTTHKDSGAMGIEMQSKAGALFRTGIHRYMCAVRTHMQGGWVWVKVKNSECVMEKGFPQWRMWRFGLIPHAEEKW